MFQYFSPPLKQNTFIPYYTVVAMLETQYIGEGFSLSLLLSFSPPLLRYSVNRHVGIDRAQQHGLADETCPL